jgi:predicted TIM-barrel fold metal-dependent hydrolase
MAVFHDYFAQFSAVEQAAIFGGTAERVYRLSA